MDTHARKIRIYRNGDMHHAGKKMLVSAYHRNFEQFLAECSRDVHLVTGGVRKLYTMEGKRVKSLSDIQDNSQYVATAGEPFKSVDYMTEEDQPPVFNGYSRTNLTILHDPPPIQRRKINRSTGGLLLDGTMEIRKSENNLSLFGPNSKAFKIAVFENGEVNYDPIKLILNHRNCKTFDQVLEVDLATKLIKSGQVRKIFDAKTGKRLRALQDIENGQNIVLSAFDPYKKVAYRTIDFTSPPTVVKKEPEQLRIVRFYPNGDSYHSGLTLTLSSRRFPTLQRLLDQLNSQIELVTGKIQKIYALDGTRIHQLEELKQTEYVLVANDDPFIKTRYNVMAIRSSTGQPGLNGATLHNEFISKIRPITTKRRTRKPTHTDNDAQSSSESPQRVMTSHSIRKSKSKKISEAASDATEKVAPKPARAEAIEKEVLKPARVVPKKVERKVDEIEEDRTPPQQNNQKVPEPESVKQNVETPKPKSAKGKDVSSNQNVKEKSPYEEGTRTPAPKTPKKDYSQQGDGPEKDTVKFVDDVTSKPTTAKSKKDAMSRASTPGIPEDENIKNQSGREEELYEKENVNVLQSVKTSRGQSAKAQSSNKLAKSQKSLSKIPKLTSRTSSLEQVQGKSETNVASEIEQQ